MQNIVIYMCEKFHYDRLRNDRALGNRKSDNNKNAKKTKKNVGSAWRPVFGSKKIKFTHKFAICANQVLSHAKQIPTTS